MVMGPQSEDPWEIDDDYSPPEYVLAGGQREFIATGDSSIYSDTKTPANAIKRKAARLPSRFQDLLDDVALLEYGGYLSETEWAEITAITPRTEAFHGENVSFTQPESANADIQFGLAMGSMIQTLHEKAPGESDWTDVVWGFLLGFVIAPPGQESKEQERLGEFISALRRRKSERYQLVSRQPDQLRHVLTQQQNSRELVEEKLKEHNIKPLDVVSDWVYKELRSRGNPITDALVDDFLEHEVNQSTLELANEVHLDLLKDAETITEQGYTHPDVDAVDVLRPLASDSDLSSHEIHTATNLPKSNVTAILDRLSDSSGTENWTIHPVVKGDRTAWNLTAYGEVVTQILYEIDKTGGKLNRKNPAGWIYNYALDPQQMDEERRELLENLLQETGHSQLRG